LKAVAVTLWALSLVLMSCGGAPTVAPVEQTPSSGQTALVETTPAPEPEPDVSPSPPEADTEPSEEEALLELVRGNVATTDLSAVVKITGVRVEGPNGAPPATTGYVNHVYEVEILTPISGCGAKKGFAFAQMADADSRPMEIGTALFVSVCRGEKGGYYTPDVGYAIPQSALPASALAALKSKKLPKDASACGE